MRKLALSATLLAIAFVMTGLVVALDVRHWSVPLAAATNDDQTTAANSDTDALPALMQRASTYVAVFESALSSVVAEEHYVQVVKAWEGTRPRPGQEPALAWKSGADDRRSKSRSTIVRRRQLLSDLLLVQTPGHAWIGYRDVAEVDGKAVRERDLRVQTLFLSGSTGAREQLQRIADESARYNLGSARNINIPTFPLQLLRATNLQHFEWTTKGQSRSPNDPATCTVVGFREVADPTLVTTRRGHNVPMTGQFCIEPETGRVWRATLNFKQRSEGVEGAFEVTFRPTNDPAVLLPERIWEWALSDDPTYFRDVLVEGEATYSNVRRFTVNTQERLQ